MTLDVFMASTLSTSSLALIIVVLHDSCQMQR
jgi:hypothetical protein